MYIIVEAEGLLSKCTFKMYIIVEVEGLLSKCI